MVKYQTILKTIEQEIRKSHQHLKLYDSLIKPFNKFHEQTCIKRQMKSEKCLICDNKGNELYSKTGGKRRISVPENVIKDLYEKNGELNLTHNHPCIGGCPAESLSASDIALVMETLQDYDPHEGWSDPYFPIKSMSCESPNGSRMSFVRGDKFQYENAGQVRQLGKELQKAYEDYLNRWSKANREIGEGLDINDFNSGPEYYKYCTLQALKKEGRFEDSKEFKRIKDGFRKLDCRLDMSYPFEFKYY